MTRQVFGFCALALGVAGLGYAQQQKIATINIQAAIVGTRDGQKAAAELESKAAPKRRAIEGKQNEINSMKDQLQKGANTLSEAAKNDLYRTIDQKTKSLNREMEDIQAEMEQEQQKAINDLGQKIYAIVSKYGQDHGLTMIVDVSNPQTPVFWALPSIDVTKDIVDLYDKEVPGASTSSSPSSKPPINTAAPGPTRSVAPGTARPAAVTPGTPTKKP